MPEPYPKAFRDDVVARRGQAPLTQIARDFGIPQAFLSNWLKNVDIEDGNRPDLSVGEAEQDRALKKRNRLLEQESEVLRPAGA